MCTSGGVGVLMDMICYYACLHSFQLNSVFSRWSATHSQIYLFDIFSSNVSRLLSLFKICSSNVSGSWSLTFFLPMFLVCGVCLTCFLPMFLVCGVCVIITILMHSKMGFNISI